MKINPIRPYFDNYSWWESPHLPNNKNLYQTTPSDGALQFGSRNTIAVRDYGVLTPVVQPACVLHISTEAKLLYKNNVVN